MVPAVAPTPPSARHLAGGNPRVRQAPSPASSLVHPASAAQQRLNSPPSGAAMSLPAASRSLLLMRGSRGTPGGWRPHTGRCSRPEGAGSLHHRCPGLAASVAQPPYGADPGARQTHGRHPWSPDTEPLPTVCSSGRHKRLLPAAFGGRAALERNNLLPPPRLGPTGAGPRVQGHTAPSPLIPQTHSAVSQTPHPVSPDPLPHTPADRGEATSGDPGGSRKSGGCRASPGKEHVLNSRMAATPFPHQPLPIVQ